jgi:hypothetical protein
VFGTTIRGAGKTPGVSLLVRLNRTKEERAQPGPTRFSSIEAAPGHGSLLGQPGCGKTHLAVALGIAAVEAGYRGYFTSATDMTKTIVAAYADRTHHNKLRTYTGPSVLVIDDVGITPFDRNEANAFFQIVNRRYENRSATIVTTNRGLQLPGPSCSAATASSPQQSSTASSTTPPSSTSAAHPGGYENTKPSPNPSPTSSTQPTNHPQGAADNLTPGTRPPPRLSVSEKRDFR